MLQHFKTPLKKRLRKYSFYHHLIAFELFAFWQKIIEKEFAQAQSRAVAFKNSALTVEVSSSVLAQELKFREVKNIVVLNRFLQKKFPNTLKLKKIYYRISG